MTTSGAAPLITTVGVQITAAGATTDATYIARVPFTGVVSAVTYVPVSAITGAATNNRTHSVTNKGDDGSGSTSVASLAWASGVDGTASAENAITLSATAANLVVTAGDILAVGTVHAGTGIADPGGTLFIQISRD